MVAASPGSGLVTIPLQNGEAFLAMGMTPILEPAVGLYHVQVMENNLPHGSVIREIFLSFQLMEDGEPTRQQGCVQ